MSDVENGKRVYTIKLLGNGGEVVLGRVPGHVYDHFRSNNVDLSDFANDAEDGQVKDEILWPFHPGEWYNCDDIAHDYGVEMSDSCSVEVYNEDGYVVWYSSLDAATLEEIGCDIETSNDINASDQPADTVVFYGQQIDYGVFFDAKLELDEDFDYTKLKFYVTDIEGWSICSGVDYNNCELDGDNFDVEETTNHFAFVKVLDNGDTESYSGPDDYDYAYDDEEE